MKHNLHLSGEEMNTDDISPFSDIILSEQGGYREEQDGKSNIVLFSARKCEEWAAKSCLTDRAFVLDDNQAVCEHQYPKEQVQCKEVGKIRKCSEQKEMKDAEK